MNTTPQRVKDDVPPPPDDKARAEAAAISSGKLRREESWQSHLHYGGLVVFWFAITIIIATVMVWIFNLLTPTRWHFLDDSQRMQVQNLIIASIGSSLVTDRVKRLLQKTSD